jgi:hypothetical protein
MASKGQIHDVFQDNVHALAAQAARQAAAGRGPGVRPWNHPEGAGSTLDIPGMTRVFDRDAIDGDYQELLGSGEDPGSCAAVISVKTQADLVASMERAYRARHATPVRCLAHALGRRMGHSSTQGVFLGGILQHAQDALKAGQS